MQTVKSFLENNKNILGVHIMSPGGFVDLSIEQIEDILKNGTKINTNLGCSGYGMEVTADEILSQVIHSPIKYNADNSVSFISGCD